MKLIFMFVAVVFLASCVSGQGTAEENSYRKMYFKYGCYEFYKKLNEKKEVEN